VSRQDVLKALQQIQRQTQVGETIDDIVSNHLHGKNNDTTVFETKVVPQMTNQLGTLSNSVLTSIITEASRRLLDRQQNSDMVVEHLTTYFLEPVQIDSILTVKPHILEAGYIYAKIDTDIYQGRKLVGKGLLTVQLIER